jgi:hypothetical protein
MKQVALTMLTGVFCWTALSAAPADEHIRGKIVSVSGDALVVRTHGGEKVSVTLNGGTHYLEVVPSSLEKVQPGSYIGTATKDIGSTQVALEVMIFPATMRGINAGHFPYDRLPDTTLSGATTTTSMMTNGNVSALSTAAGETVNTTMTNGEVSGGTAENGAKELTVTYKGGEQRILVPPTAPIVVLNPATAANLTEGAYVFVDAMRDGQARTAGLVAVGVNGMRPPF